MRMFLCIIPNKPLGYCSFFTLKYNISTLLELYHLVLCNVSITHNVHYEMIHNANRTKWSPIQFVIIQVINKIRQLQSRSLICQSLIWLQTELDDKKFCYQLIITITISGKKKHLGQTSPVGTMSKAKNFKNITRWEQKYYLHDKILDRLFSKSNIKTYWRKMLPFSDNTIYI